MKILLVLFALTAFAADPPKADPLTDKDARVYLVAALKQARAEAAHGAAAVKFLDARETAQRAGAELRATSEKLKSARGCPKCEIDDETLTWTEPPVIAPAPPPTP